MITDEQAARIRANIERGEALETLITANIERGEALQRIIQGHEDAIRSARWRLFRNAALRTASRRMQAETRQLIRANSVMLAERQRLIGENTILLRS